jgi:hypothetical protein
MLILDYILSHLIDLNFIGLKMAQSIYWFKLPTGYHEFLCESDTLFQTICKVMIENKLIYKLPIFFANGKRVAYNATIGSVNPIGPIAVLEDQEYMMFLQYLNGERLSIPVNRNTTFTEVRAMLAHIGKSPNMRFILCGKVVEDTETMESVNVFANPVVHIV